MESAHRVCKSKNCRKSLPEGYKHWYCEACRNKHTQALKNTGKGVLGIAGVVLIAITGVSSKK